MLIRQVNASKISYTEEAVAGSITAVIGKDKFYVITSQPINTSNQKDDLQKELTH